MARAFNQQEKEMIRSLLLERGREYFSLYGLKKTSIEELTRAAGIAQGTFYNFYKSKEELYFDIVEEEEKVLQKRLAENLDRVQITAESLKSFFVHAFNLVDQNPILKRMYMGDEYQLLIRKISPDRIKVHMERDTRTLLPLIVHWQQQGIMVKTKPEAVVGLFRALFTITLHKKEIGEQYYPDTIELLAELIAKGLVIERADEND